MVIGSHNRKNNDYHSITYKIIKNIIHKFDFYIYIIIYYFFTKKHWNFRII